MPVQVVYIAPELLPAAWTAYSKEHLSRVVEQAPGFTLDSIYQAIADSRMSLWLVAIDAKPVASFTTCIQQYPECKELECVHLGGERLVEWAAEAVVALNEFGKANGCKSMVTFGRKGTEKLYKTWGFEFDAVRMSRRIA